MGRINLRLPPRIVNTKRLQRICASKAAPAIEARRLKDEIRPLIDSVRFRQGGVADNIWQPAHARAEASMQLAPLGSRQDNDWRVGSGSHVRRAREGQGMDVELQNVADALSELADAELRAVVTATNELLL